MVKMIILKKLFYKNFIICPPSPSFCVHHALKLCRRGIDLVIFVQTHCLMTPFTHTHMQTVILFSIKIPYLFMLHITHLAMT